MYDGLMDNFCLFNKTFGKLEIAESDHYTKLIHLEQIRLFQERLEENNISLKNIPIDLLMPKEMDVRLSVLYAHRKLSRQMKRAKDALPWSNSHHEYDEHDDDKNDLVEVGVKAVKCKK